MQVFGHRGSPGFPRHGENTLASFRRALEEGAHGVEFDIRRCGDDQLVVIHDETLNRTTNGSGRIAALSYSEISRFDAGHGEAVPLLSEVLDQLRNQCRLNIEVKESGIAEEVVSLVSIRDMAKEVVVSGFEPLWDELAAISSRIPIALLCSSDNFQVIPDAVGLGAEAIHVKRETVGQNLIDTAHEARLAVRIFTVNAPEDIRRLHSLGADAIFSDFPGRATQVLKDAKR